MPYIYIFTFPNGKQYIGQTIKSTSRRWNAHKRVSYNKEAREYNDLCHRAIRKYGWSNVKKEVLCECNREDLNDLECKYIAKYNSMTPNGYNMTSGGSENMECSDITKNRMRESALRRFSKDSEKEKMSLAAKRRFRNPKQKELQSKLMRERDSTPLRKCNDTRHLPKYIRMERGKNGVRYRIQDHPKCKSKSFGYNLRDIAEPEASKRSYSRCLAYMFALNNIDEINNINKKTHELTIQSHDLSAEIAEIKKSLEKILSIIKQEENGSETK